MADKTPVNIDDFDKLKKTFQSIQRRSQEVNVVQVDFNAVLTSAKMVIIVLTAREACFISSLFP
ncbi:hypothetical protein P5673_022333 [Acropora cervicornis]|uniref:Uncharacterized protein n=1 Tax=Acropora cervicornis TaxID=6130 RepID=A0AAD9UZK5_ACRCE|nr:hypothetical protein P5673_022333 [Acropora cervicornis]